MQVRQNSSHLREGVLTHPVCGGVRGCGQSAPCLLKWSTECIRGERAAEAVVTLGLRVSAVPLVQSARGSGYDAKLARAFAVCGGARGLGDRSAGLLLILTADASTVAGIAGRGRSLPLDPAQHDQIDAASTPALVGQVTMERPHTGYNLSG